MADAGERSVQHHLEVPELGEDESAFPFLASVDVKAVLVLLEGPTRCATRSEEVASQQEILGLPRSGMSPQMGNLTHDTHRSAQLS
jgi:hypothetical protein